MGKSKKTTEKGMAMANDMQLMREPKRASIEKAKNGYIVSQGYGMETHIAKDMKEAIAICEKIMK